jgi:hypothetical protein
MLVMRTAAAGFQSARLFDGGKRVFSCFRFAAKGSPMSAGRLITIRMRKNGTSYFSMHSLDRSVRTIDTTANEPSSVFDPGEICLPRGLHRSRRHSGPWREFRQLGDGVSRSSLGAGPVSQACQGVVRIAMAITQAAGSAESRAVNGLICTTGTSWPNFGALES